MNAKKTLIGLSLLGLTLAYTGCAPAAQETATATETATETVPETTTEMTSPATEEALSRVRGLLTEGINTVPTPEAAETFRNLRTTLEASGDPSLEVVAVAVSDVETALAAEPFEQATLIAALQSLALEMRVAAKAGDASLMVEVASLVDQTAALIEEGGYTPRLEVDVP